MAAVAADVSSPLFARGRLAVAVLRHSLLQSPSAFVLPCLGSHALSLLSPRKDAGHFLSTDIKGRQQQRKSVRRRRNMPTKERRRILSSEVIAEIPAPCAQNDRGDSKATKGEIKFVAKLVAISQHIMKLGTVINFS